MAERFTNDLLFILIVLLVAAILGFLIGYFLSRSRKHQCTECEANKEQINALKLQLAELKTSLAKQQAITSSASKEVKTAEKQIVNPVFDASLASNILGRKIRQDDLQIIKGIGPKISKILQKKGIHVWSDLNKTKADTIKDILLTEGGEKYHIHETETWPEQAEFALNGQWQKLKDFQGKLINGKLTQVD